MSFFDRIFSKDKDKPQKNNKKSSPPPPNSNTEAAKSTQVTPSAPASASMSGPVGFPPHVSNDPTFQEAITNLNKAIHFERERKNPAAAFEHYELGLQLLFSVLKLVPNDDANESTKQKLRNLISTHMSHAEEAKKKKLAREAGVPYQPPQVHQRPTSGPYIAPSLLMPVRTNSSSSSSSSSASTAVSSSASSTSSSSSSPTSAANAVAKVDPVLRASIENEIVTAASNINFQSIIGLEEAKAALNEVVIFPALRPDLFKGVRAPTRGLLLYGAPGTGKCWQKGTKLMKLDGSSIAVENIAEGEALMGDDSTPRFVARGSRIKGYSMLYRIESENQCRNSWCCNFDHILVLRWCTRPSNIEALPSGRWQFSRVALSSTTEQPELFTKQFDSLMDAQTAFQIDTVNAAPLELEYSVEDFMKLDEKVRRRALMFQPEIVHFPTPSLSLQQRLSNFTGSEQISHYHLLQCAWQLGHSLSGASSSAAHHEALLFQAIWRSYDLSQQRPLPRSLLQESPDVRRCILAGFLQHDIESLSALPDVIDMGLASLTLAESVCELARGLGYSATIRSKFNTSIDSSVTVHLIREGLGSHFMITEAGEGEWFGFTFERSNGRCLMADGLVTHNTMLAKAVATESHCTFFNVSAASLMSKHLGEGEKMVRALFDIAREKAPAIIFVDEIDSILTRRSSEEHEASRRLKTQFFIEFDKLLTIDEGAKRVVLIAATNCAEELDEALIRRLQRRIYIPLPAVKDRIQLIQALLNQPSLTYKLSSDELKKLAEQTDGYSNSDLTALVTDAAMGPLRQVSPQQLLQVKHNQLEPIGMKHFEQALLKVRPSVTKERLAQYAAWAKSQEGKQ